MPGVRRGPLTLSDAPGGGGRRARDARRKQRHAPVLGEPELRTVLPRLAVECAMRAMITGHRMPEIVGPVRLLGLVSLL
jgi:hypothetical protein